MPAALAFVAVGELDVRVLEGDCYKQNMVSGWWER